MKSVDIMSLSIVDFFSNNHTKDVINKLKAAGVNLSNIRKEAKTASNNNMENKSFVVTGTTEWVY